MKSAKITQPWIRGRDNWRRVFTSANSHIHRVFNYTWTLRLLFGTEPETTSAASLGHQRPDETAWAQTSYVWVLFPSLTPVQPNHVQLIGPVSGGVVSPLTDGRMKCCWCHRSSCWTTRWSSASGPQNPAGSRICGRLKLELGEV